MKGFIEVNSEYGKTYVNINSITFITNKVNVDLSIETVILCFDNHICVKETYDQVKHLIIEAQ